MKATNVINYLDYLNYLVQRVERDYTMRLKDIVYSKAHGHEICIMQQLGRSSLLEYTVEELLSNLDTMIGLSPEDTVTITRLDHLIKERKKKLLVLEVDRNGSILLIDFYGNEQRYSEKHISSSRELIKEMKSEDAHDLGYRVGFREGLFAKKYPKQSSNIKSKFFRLISFRRNKY